MIALFATWKAETLQKGATLADLEAANVCCERQQSMASVGILDLPPLSCGTLDKLLNLSVPRQGPHL